MTFLVVHCRDIPRSDCGIHIKFPEGGYRYPSEVNETDTGLIFVQFKDSLDRHDSFKYAYTGYHYLKSFDEANLSLRPSGQTIFRLTYDTWGDTPFVVTISCDKIVIKIGESGTPYPVEDTRKLNEKEKLHYEILQREFPIDTIRVSEWRKRYLDSLVRLYPELSSPLYYRNVLEKSLNYDSLPFKYSTYVKAISEDKFLSIVDQISKSGFWGMPYSMTYSPAPTDGGGYTFEAHTREKFKFVVSSNCPEISSELTRVCQDIINFGKPLNKNLVLCH